MRSAFSEAFRRLLPEGIVLGNRGDPLIPFLGDPLGKGEGVLVRVAAGLEEVFAAFFTGYARGRHSVTKKITFSFSAS